MPRYGIKSDVDPTILVRATGYRPDAPQNGVERSEDPPQFPCWAATLVPLSAEEQATFAAAVSDARMVASMTTALRTLAAAFVAGFYDVGITDMPVDNDAAQAALIAAEEAAATDAQKIAVLKKVDLLQDYARIMGQNGWSWEQILWAVDHPE